MAKPGTPRNVLLRYMHTKTFIGAKTWEKEQYIPIYIAKFLG
jgi:hypothetical protein